MPRYVFNIEGDSYPETDEDGTMLAGPAEARAEVVRMAGELLAEFEGRFWSRAEWRFVVTDEQGAPV